MNNKEAELVLECMAVDMTGALCDTKEPMRDVLQQRIEAINIAQKALQENGSLSGEPLTLEQLLEMDGKVVRVKLLEKTQGTSEGLALVYKDNGYAACQRFTTWTLWYKEYGKTWIAYAYQPSHIDREAWDYCESCKPDCYNCLYQDAWDTHGKPDRCKKCVEFSNHVADESFCEKCGRPRTTEAWDELEKRIEVE